MATKFIPISVQLGLGNAREKLRELGNEFDNFGKKGSKASDTIRGIKEGISSLSSEVIESFGLDGDIANLFGKQIAGINASTLALGGFAAAGVGVAAGIGVLTLKLAGQAAELRSTAAATQLSVEALQEYRNVAQVTGVSTDTLADAVVELREKGLEAQKGSKEAAAALNVFGISAKQAATAPQQSFENLLNQIQKLPDNTSRANAVTLLFGQGNRELSRAVLELTENQGALRTRLKEVGVVMDEAATRDLAALNREYELLILQGDYYYKKTLVGIFNGLKGLSRANFDFLSNPTLGGAIFAANSALPSLPDGSDSTVGADGPVATNKTQAQKIAELLGNAPKNKPGGGSKGSKPQTEVQQLANQLKDVNQQIKILSDQTSEEYQIKVRLEDARGQLKDLEELFKFQTRGERSGARGVSPDKILNDVNEQILGAIFEQREKQANEELKARTKAAEEEKKIANLLTETAEAFRERLEDLQVGGDGSSNALTTRRRLRKAGATGEAADSVIAQAEELDRAEKAARDYADAVELGRQRQEQFADFVRSQFDNLLEGPRAFFDGLKQLFKRGLSDLLTGLVVGNRGGGGGFLSNLGGNLSGLLTGGGGGGGFSLGNLFRTPGFNPAASVAGGSGAAAGGGGLLSNLFGSGGGGLLSSIGTKIGPKLASIFGGVGFGSGGLGGGVSVGIGSAGGAGLGSTIAALATNPFTIAAAGAIGGFLIFRALRKRGQYSRDVKKAVQSQYGVEVSNDVVKQIKQIGQGRYGKDYANRVSETVALPEVRDLVADYAEQTGQQGNSKLFNLQNLSDPFYRDNRFVIAENGRGISPSSSSSSTGGVPAIVQAAQAGGQALLANAIMTLANKITSIPAKELIVANADAVGEAFQTAFANNGAIGEQVGRAVNP